MKPVISRSLAPACLAALGVLLPYPAEAASPSQESETTEAPDATPQGAEATDESGTVDAELADPVQAARQLARRWSSASYVITRGRKEVGTYVQQNVVQRARDKEVLEFHDAVTIGKATNRLAARTVLELAPGLPMLLFQAQVDVDQIELAFAAGRAKGSGLMKSVIDVEIPDATLTAMQLLRGLPRMPRVKGASAEFTLLKPEALPAPEALVPGTLRCAGQDDLEIAGQVYVAWKYRWRTEGERPVFLWYGEDGQLLRREQRKEVWLYDPEGGKED